MSISHSFSILQESLVLQMFRVSIEIDSPYLLMSDFECFFMRYDANIRLRTIL